MNFTWTVTIFLKPHVAIGPIKNIYYMRKTCFDKKYILNSFPLASSTIQEGMPSPAMIPCPWHGALCLRREGSRKPVDKGVLFVFKRKEPSFWHFWEASPLPPKEQHFLKSRYLLLLSWETVCEVERKLTTSFRCCLDENVHTTGKEQEQRREGPGMEQSEGVTRCNGSCRKTKERGGCRNNKVVTVWNDGEQVKHQLNRVC